MRLYLAILLLSLSVNAFSGVITSVASVKNDKGGTSIEFKGLDVQPTAFVIKEPASIVLDFPNTTSELLTKRNPINNEFVESVDVITNNQATRAVINLKKEIPYTLRKSGNSVFVDLSGQQASISSNPLQQLSIAGSDKSKQSYSIKEANTPKKRFSLKERFNKSGNDAGVLSFLMPGNADVIDVQSKDQQIIAIINGYSIDKKDEKRMDVADYGTLVRYIDIEKQGNNTKITLDMGRNPYTFVEFQNGGRFNIQVSEPQQADIAEITGFGSDKSYHGDTLSLNFQDIEVRAVLAIIAEFTGQNIVVSDSVSGSITLLLNNVPWDQALDIILKTKSLAMRRSGSIIYIAPQAELNQSEIEALTDYQRKKELLPSETMTIQLKYTSATDLMNIIKESRSQGSTGGSNGYALSDNALLSSKGSVIADSRTNTLIISDIPSKLQAIRDLVAKLDEPVRQVLIDSRLVVTSDNFSRDLGSKFGFAFNGRGGNTNVGGAGSLEGANTAAGLGGKGQIGSVDLGDRLGVNLPAASGSTPGSLGLAILGSDVLIDLELQALQSEGRSEIVSSPRVVTQDGYKALVSSGQEIPYSTTSNDGTNVEFKDAKLSMDVTPRITPNNRVGMDIHITKDSADWGNAVNGEPPLDTNEINTRVEVDNGETIVLGGIYEQTQMVTTSKVPLLGDIPILGNAFKSTSKSFNKNELLIFITPRVVDQKLTQANKFSSLNR